MNCLFCNILIESSKNPEDIILDESKSFYLKPALGHFIEGYSLLITKQHFLSYAFLPRHLWKEFNSFKEKVVKNIKIIYKKNIIMFEHGEVDLSHPAGCCIPHAHLHIIPIDFDIHDILLNEFNHYIIKDYKELELLKDKYLSYIFYETQYSEKYIFIANEIIVGQLVRRIICEKLNIKDQWDWAVFPFRENIIKFNKKYKSVAFNQQILRRM